MMNIPGIFTINLVMANFGPIDESSNKNIGIFVVDHAPIKIKIFQLWRDKLHF